MTRSGVLLTAFGGPDSLAACGPFMRNLMGREPSEEQLTRVRSRYQAIGGCSPLPAVVARIAEALGAEMGPDVPVAAGMRYSEPSIATALETLAGRGVARAVMLSLSPFESKVASGAYRSAAATASASLGIELVEAPHLGGTEGFWSAHAGACSDALSGLGWAGYENPAVLMSAHSLPLEDLTADDPYVSGLAECAQQVAHRAGLSEAGTPWGLWYQSKGNRPGEWMGPLLEEGLESARRGGHDAVAVCPIGFLTDHMETVYDLDIEFALEVSAAGLGFARAAVPNDSPAMVRVMREAVETSLS